MHRKGYRTAARFAGLWRASLESGRRGGEARPLEEPGLTAKIAPFVGVVVLAYALGPIAHGGFSAQLVVSASMIPPIVASGYLVPWAKLPAWAQAVPPI